MVSGRLHPLWVIVVAVVALAAGLLGGYEWGHSTASSTGAPAPHSGSPILSITGAGTLGTAFPEIASLLVNQTSGAQDPIASQQYQGSLAALAVITSSHQAEDVAAAADYRLIPQLLEPTYASWEVLFASNPEVLTFDPTVSALSGINASNWVQKITSSGVVVGFANASTDPNGYNEIFVLELEGILQNGSASALYSHFFNGAVGAYATPNPSTAKLESETQVATLLSTHAVAAFITYQSYAITHHLHYVSFDASVGLGSFNASQISTYGQASTSILGSNGQLEVVHGAPVAFAATVPLNAPNATLGDLFVHLVLSTQGEALLQSLGFTPMVPGYWAGSSSPPDILQPLVVPLPADLSPA